VNPHRLRLHFTSLCLVVISFSASAQNRQSPPGGGRTAVVVDERFAALRTTPDLTGKLVRRMGRGRLLSIRSIKNTRTGIVFYFVKVSSRTRGWIQREAVVVPSQNGNAERLLSLIKNSSDYDRIVLARLFLDYFPRSPFRSQVLLMLGEAAEEASVRLSQEAARRMINNTSAPEFSYFLNYRGLDRYNRQGVTFVFDQGVRRLRYDGSAWKELLRRFPRSAEAEEARKRLGN
jgi:hypothetical protein